MWSPDLTGVLLRVAQTGESLPHPHLHKEEVTCAHRKMASPTNHEKKPQNETYPVSTVIFSVSKTVKNIFLLFTPPSLWYFVMAAPADYKANRPCSSRQR